MVREEGMYPTIRNCLLEGYGGFSIKGFSFRENFPVRKIGRPDIVIAVDTGSSKTPDIELWVVEVKKKNEKILDSLTQTLKYSLFAHRCHLAVRFGKKSKGFSSEDIFLAESLGVGLIEFRYDKVNMVNFSKKFNPILSKVDEVMKKLDFIKCNICGNYVNIDKIGKKYNVNLFAGWLNQGKLDSRKIRYSKGSKRSTNICEDCFNNLF
jgi:hypothetical protein